MQLVTVAQMRALDRLTIERYGTPGYTLMQRAGRGAVAVLLAEFPRRGGGRVVVCAGRGNNGGDGFVIARELRRRRIPVEVFLLGTAREVRGDAARALAEYRRAGGTVEPCRSARHISALRSRLRGAAVAVDAIVGTGLTGPVDGVPAEVIALLNGSGTPVFAVDIPSGLDADRGVPLGPAVRARATATFGFAKIGQVTYPGIEYVGRLAVVDIGIAAEAVEAVAPRARLLEDGDMGPLVPVRAPTAHKGDTGHLLVIAGGLGKTGAAKLCALGAARAGAGLVTAAVPASQQPVVAAGLLEAMTAVVADRAGEVDFDPAALAQLLDGKRAVAVGPGIGTGAGARATVEWLLEHAAVPVVVDADGLNCLAGRVDRIGGASAQVVLTPHPGEMARLTGLATAEVQADRVAAARRLAGAQRCTVVLKGARTVIAGADGAVAVNPTGNPGMASGGMGDVLTGILGGLLAQGLGPVEAAGLAAYVHGMAADEAAADHGVIGLIASDVIDRIPRVLRRLQSRPYGA